MSCSLDRTEDALIFGVHRNILSFARFPICACVSVFFFLMIRPPPRSPLFPYTTLFRSEVYATLLDEGTYLCSERTMYRLLAEHAEVRERRDQLRHPVYAAPELLARRPNELWSWDIDRKSTRLNSSHGYNSYAVFCLNKRESRRSHPRILTRSSACPRPSATSSTVDDRRHASYAQSSLASAISAHTTVATPCS